MPKSNTTYFALLTQADKTTIDSFIRQTKFSSFDTSYYESYQDGLDYQFYFGNDTTSKLIRVHSDSVPAQLRNLKDWIVERKKSLPLHQMDSTIAFKSAKDFLAPPVDAPHIQFTPPTIK